MDYNDFINKIAFSKEMNPFHDSFSEENLKKHFAKYVGNDDASSQLAFAVFILISNSIYKEFYGSMRKLFTKKNNYNDYYLYSLSIANHDSILARKDMMNKSLNSERLDLIQMSRAYMDIGATENSVGNILDGIGDTLDFNFNLIRFLSTPCLQSDTIMKPSSEFFKYFYKSNIFCVLKTLFEKICFENEKCEYKNGILYLRNPDESFNILKSVAFYAKSFNSSLL